jgi:hypothetical protein
MVWKPAEQRTASIGDACECGERLRQAPTDIGACICRYALHEVVAVLIPASATSLTITSGTRPS